MPAKDFRLSLAPLAAEPPLAGPPPGMPPAYGREKLEAVVRDSRSLWLYWELSPSKIAEIAQVPGDWRAQIHLVLAETRQPAEEATCELERGRAWLQALPGGRYYAELGLAVFGRPFRTLLRSGEFRMPWGEALHARAHSTLELPEELRRFKPPPRDA
ncbi:MAG: DUF4912 domain-containing protein [Elusimicrobia bacterium]|nr:DUF4912 domain-containing protein [Elusimicrobiota bacterium]